MATDKSKKRRLRPAPSVRERAQQAQLQAEQPRRLQRTAGSITRPLKWVARAGRKEVYLPLPESGFWRFMNKRRYVVPRYFRESWHELRDVTWPGRRETRQLTIAVFLFAIVFGLLITLTDYGLDKLFRKLLLKH